MELNEVIRRLRQSKGLTQKNVADDAPDTRDDIY